MSFLPKSAAIFFMCFTLSYGTLSDYGLTWDELVYIRAAKSYTGWFQGFRDSGFKIFKEREVRKFWKVNEEHPPVGKLLLAGTGTVFSSFLGEVGAYRMASVILYSALVCLVFLFMKKHSGEISAWASALFIAFLPVFFGHSHFAALDIPTCFLWVLCAFTFYEGLSSTRMAFCFAIAYGLGLATRFSFVLLAPAFLLFGLVFFRKKVYNNLFFMLVVTPVIFYAVQPLFWHHPLESFYRSVQVNVNRLHGWDSIPVYYLGKIWWKRYPFSYPYVLTFATLPATVCLLFFSGLARCFIRRFKDIFLVYLLLNVILPFFVFLPATAPRYDSVRLFLQAFPFVACLSGAGFQQVLEVAFHGLKGSARWGACAGFAAGVFFFTVWPLYRVHPYELSYYGEFIGGLSGATEHGFETTYWGEVVDRRFLDMLNRRLPENARVVFVPFSGEVLDYYKKTGLLRDDIQTTGVSIMDFKLARQVDFMVMISRQGLFTRDAWKMYQTFQPLYRKEYQGVTLLAVYDTRSMRKKTSNKWKN